MARIEGITLDGKPLEIDDDEDEQDNEQEDSEDLDQKPDQTEDKVKKKERLEAELSQLDEGAQEDAEEIAEDISDSNPETGQVASESREAAKDIAGEYNLSKQAEDKLANAITQKVLENLRGNSSGEKKPRPRTPDKRPKPTHFSERTVFGRRRDG